MADLGESAGLPVVCVFGSADPAEGTPQFQIAYETGRELARLGYVVANGGYDGTMLASARGAKDAGGKTVGVTCELWSRIANPYVDEVVVTGSLAERGRTLIELGTSGYVVLRGGTGTLLELATVWEFMAKKAMPTRPIVCVGPFWRSLFDAIVSVSEKARRFVQFVDVPAGLADHFPPVAASG